jgi:putative DNA primase/helicase
MHNAFETKTKTKHMITNHNAETAELNGSVSKIENSSPSPRGEGTGEGDRDTRQPELHDTTPRATNDHSPIKNQKSKFKNPDGQYLLNYLESLLERYVVLPTWAPETLALWVLHTYAFELRDVSTYLGIESPEKRCGKTTLLGVLNRLANRPVPAANISSSAFFRVIEEMRPTLLIDEADTFLRTNDELRGILNAGYTRDTAFVVRVTQTDLPLSSGGLRTGSARALPLPVRRGEGSDSCPTLDTRHSSLRHFSCWCPKVMAAIGRLPETLADRCIVIRMQRKTIHEECERLRNLDTSHLREQFTRFVEQNANAIATARPAIPESLNDRAADIWEPLLALADIAGGDWPAKARRAAEGLTASAQGRSPIGALLFDIYAGIARKESERIFSRDLVDWLNGFTDRPWLDLPGLRFVDSGKRKQMTELWLAQQLRPYGLRPRTIRIGDNIAKGYVLDEMIEVFQRYVPRSELDNFKAEFARAQAERASSPGQRPSPGAATPAGQ